MNDDGASHDCCAEAIRERFKRCLLEHYKPMTRQFFVTLTDKILLSFSIALASINLVLTKLGTHVLVLRVFYQYLRYSILDL